MSAADNTFHAPRPWPSGEHELPDGSTRTYYEPKRGTWADEPATSNEFDEQGLFYDGVGWWNPYGLHIAFEIADDDTTRATEDQVR